MSGKGGTVQFRQRDTTSLVPSINSIINRAMNFRIKPELEIVNKLSIGITHPINSSNYANALHFTAAPRGRRRESANIFNGSYYCIALVIVE